MQHFEPVFHDVEPKSTLSVETKSFDAKDLFWMAIFCMRTTIDTVGTDPDSVAKSRQSDSVLCGRRGVGKGQSPQGRTWPMKRGVEVTPTSDSSSSSSSWSNIYIFNPHSNPLSYSSILNHINMNPCISMLYNPSTSSQVDGHRVGCGRRRSAVGHESWSIELEVS